MAEGFKAMFPGLDAAAVEAVYVGSDGDENVVLEKLMEMQAAQENGDQGSDSSDGQDHWKGDPYTCVATISHPTRGDITFNIVKAKPPPPPGSHACSAPPFPAIEQIKGELGVGSPQEYRLEVEGGDLPQNFHQAVIDGSLTPDLLPALGQLGDTIVLRLVPRVRNRTITVYVKMLTGKTVELQMDLADNFLDLKFDILDAEGIPPDQQRIIFGGKQFENHDGLGETGVGNKDSLHLVLRLRGD